MASWLALQEALLASHIIVHPYLSSVTFAHTVSQHARQRDRRNLTKKQLNYYTSHVIQAKDKLKAEGQGARSLLASGDASRGKSAAELAAQVGVSQATVERTRAVLGKESGGGNCTFYILEYAGVCWCAIGLPNVDFVTLLG